jgi:MFS family permease
MPSNLARPLQALFWRPPDAPATPEQVKANIRYLVLEVTWFGVVWGAVAAFLQVYIVRLGASSLLVGAITYGPALINILWQMPAARMINHAGHRMVWVIGGGFFYRVTFLAVALIPFVFPKAAAEVTALVWVLATFAITIGNVTFLSMLADAVPAARMTQVVGWRIAGFGLSNTITTLLGGQFLRLLPFPLNYQLLFLIGFAGSMMSWLYIRRIHVADPPPVRGKQPALLRDIGRMLRYPHFGRFVVTVGVLQLALGMIAPLLPLYWVRNLGATDAQVSVIMTVASGTLVIGSLLVRRLVGRIGRARVLALGALGYAFYPILTSFSPSAWWLIPWAALSGLFNAAMTVTMFDNLVFVSPHEDRTSYIAVYNVGVNIALFVGPILAGLVAQDAAGVVLALRLAAGIGLAAGVLLALRRDR